MIRVLFVEASTGGVVGGSLTGLVHLIRGLDRKRFRVAMALYEPKGIEEELARLGVTVHYVARRRIRKEHSLLQYENYHRAKRLAPVRSTLRLARQTVRLLIEEFPAAVSLARLMRVGRVDVVHLGNGLRANFDGLLAGLMTGKPVVCHIKGFEKYGARERWAARHTRILVCMTRAVLEHCRAHGIAAPAARVVYDGVDESWLTVRRPPSVVRAELGVPAAAPCVGMAGNIQEWKGQHVLVEAMPKVIEARPDAHALIVGGVHRAGEAYAKQLRERCSVLGLDARVHFAGFRKDVVDVMNALDVVVHASVRPEPFGRVILEGMLLGKPVVAAAAGGVPELIEDGRTGFLVPSGDVVALANRLAETLGAPDDARTIGECGREWARQRFALARQVEEMSEIYEEAGRE